MTDDTLNPERLTQPAAQSEAVDAAKTADGNAAESDLRFDLSLKPAARKYASVLEAYAAGLSYDEIFDDDLEEEDDSDLDAIIKERLENPGELICFTLEELERSIAQH
ncbi:MAG: hypothetical protein IAB19_08420 [Proteobacteria bacterium]|uniref:Uncharacterized protein n=1 Tax=Candidatus Avisuccinivibrio stercorigallinarum TaxID=2840704 RepID=A0A9D9DDF0_9GAMM|nr:hypothetical protein [Candidatus Avisuccinivibrio stercorigallinarum]